MTDAQDIRPRAAVTLALLFGMNLLDYIDRNILAAVLPHIQEEMGLSSTQAGALRAGLPDCLHRLCPADGLGWRPLQPDQVTGLRCRPVEPRHCRSGVCRYLWASRAGA